MPDVLPDSIRDCIRQSLSVYARAVVGDGDRIGVERRVDARVESLGAPMPIDRGHQGSRDHDDST